jgi:hypothetical protein
MIWWRSCALSRQNVSADSQRDNFSLSPIRFKQAPEEHRRPSNYGPIAQRVEELRQNTAEEISHARWQHHVRFTAGACRTVNGKRGPRLSLNAAQRRGDQLLPASDVRLRKDHHMKHLFAGVALTALLAACTSTPPPSTASAPLSNGTPVSVDDGAYTMPGTVTSGASGQSGGIHSQQ